MTHRVVFDCNVYFQAIISSCGPAAELVASVRSGRLKLFSSSIVFGELRAVCLRPALVTKFRLTPEAVDEFIDEVTRFATIVENVPHVFHYERDPDDEHYVDLAVAMKANIIATRDKDLLALSDESSPEGRAFRMTYPAILVLTPTELLDRLRKDESA